MDSTQYQKSVSGLEVSPFYVMEILEEAERLAAEEEAANKKKQKLKKNKKKKGDNEEEAEEEEVVSLADPFIKKLRGTKELNQLVCATLCFD